MTAPTVNGARYPQPVDQLVPSARQLADELGDVPSRNQLMRHFRIGAPKAGELLALLRATADQDAAAVPAPTTVPAAAAPPVPGPAHPVRPDLRPVFVAPTLRPVPGGADPVSPARPGPHTPPQASSTGHPGTPADRRHLLRVRWAVRLVLVLGVAASIAGNVLHARDNLISQVISAWSPLALLLTVELISRVPVHRRLLAAVRWAATALIAGIAAWVSYFHMAAVASRYGESGGAQYLLPLSVDGLVVVASICLVELGGRIAAASRP
ncbi:DUF2637 domain-containing protein [Micromonospora marina]|uniref:DUF2637 domain-containing protein n=1 Tax=Micromonospora marina TaxID=307120 RepID=UPI003456D25F